mgnify:CR=1 FL=1
MACFTSSFCLALFLVILTWGAVQDFWWFEIETAGHERDCDMFCWIAMTRD